MIKVSLLQPCLNAAASGRRVAGVSGSLASLRHGYAQHPLDGIPTLRSLATAKS